MNTFFLKDLWMMLNGRIKMASIPARLRFYIYFFALIISCGIMYSSIADPAPTASSNTTASSDTSTSTTAPVVTSPVLPVPIVNPSLDSLIGIFTNAAPAWGTTLVSIAKNLFYLLATIEIVWTGIRLTLRQADLMEWASELVYQVLFIGFFLALLTNSATWSQMIIQSFNTAGQTASGAGGGPIGISPTNIFTIGYQIANNILSDIPFIKSGDAFFLVLSALIVLVCSSLIAAFMILTLIETYLAVYGGIIFMGFGGSRFTSQIAIKTLMYTFAAGAKLFFVQLLGGLTETQLASLLQEFKGFTTISNTIIFKVIGMSIILMIIIKRAPEILQSMLNGINFDFSFMAPSSDSGPDVTSTPISPSITINALKESLAIPSGYMPSVSGFNTGMETASTESLGSRLLDIDNTSIRTSTESGNFNPESPPFDMTPRVIPTSSQNDTSDTSTVNDTVSPETGIGTSASSRAGIPSEGGRDNTAVKQGAAEQNSTSTPSFGLAQQAGAQSQSTSLGGHFGSSPDAAANLTDIPNTPDQGDAGVTSATSALGGQQQQTTGTETAIPNTPAQPSQSDVGVTSPTSTLGGQQQQTTVGITAIPNTSAQPGQGDAGVTSATSALGGQQQTTIAGVETAIPNTPVQPGQGDSGVTSPTSALGGQQQAEQQTNMAFSPEKASVASVAGVSEDMGGKLAPDLPSATPVSGSSVPSDNTIQVSSTGSTSTAPSTSAVPASTAPASAAPPTSAAPISTAPTSTAPSTSATPISTAPESTAPPTSAAPVSTAPASAVPPTSAAPISTAPTSTAPSTSAAPENKSPASSGDSNNKNTDGKKADTDNKNSNSKSADGDSKSNDKKSGSDNKKADSNSDDKNKTNDSSKQDDDKKKKPEDPNKNDDSFDDKNKKPRNPKDDPHDKK